jgi:hypothetical protein
MKRVKAIETRSKFCKLAITDKKKAANELRVMATGLENCRNTSDVINALTNIFAVSERTVFNDLVK